MSENRGNLWVSEGFKANSCSPSTDCSPALPPHSVSSSKPQSSKSNSLDGSIEYVPYITYSRYKNRFTPLLFQSVFRRYQLCTNRCRAISQSFIDFPAKKTSLFVVLGTSLTVFWPID